CPNSFCIPLPIGNRGARLPLVMRLHRTKSTSSRWSSRTVTAVFVDKERPSRPSRLAHPRRARPRRFARWLAAIATAVACGRAPGASTSAATAQRIRDSASRAFATLPPDSVANESDVLPYTGHGPYGIPHYALRTFSAADRELLRRVYGIEDPTRLYVSDSSEDGLLKY